MQVRVYNFGDADRVLPDAGQNHRLIPVGQYLDIDLNEKMIRRITEGSQFETAVLVPADYIADEKLQDIMDCMRAFNGTSHDELRVVADRVLGPGVIANFPTKTQIRLAFIEKAKEIAGSLNGSPHNVAEALKADPKVAEEAAAKVEENNRIAAAAAEAEKERLAAEAIAKAEQDALENLRIQGGGANDQWQGDGSGNDAPAPSSQNDAGEGGERINLTDPAPQGLDPRGTEHDPQPNTPAPEQNAAEGGGAVEGESENDAALRAALGRDAVAENNSAEGSDPVTTHHEGEGVDEDDDDAGDDGHGEDDGAGDHDPAEQGEGAGGDPAGEPATAKEPAKPRTGAKRGPKPKRTGKRGPAKRK